MKACSQCGSTYSDRIEFCFVDGVVLDVSAVAPATSGAADPWDVPSPASFDLPAPPPQVHRAAMVPTPLAPFALPLKQVASPLNVAPPPPVAPAGPPPAAAPPSGASSSTPAAAPAVSGASPVSATPSAAAPIAAASSAAAHAPQSAGAAASAPTKAATTGTPDEHTKAVPPWVWWAALGVAAVLLVGAMVFAAGSLGVLGAAATRGQPPQAAQANAQGELAPSPASVDGQASEPAAAAPEPDDERFPAEPLEIGVVAVDGPGAAAQPVGTPDSAVDGGSPRMGTPVDYGDQNPGDPSVPPNRADRPAGPPLVLGTQNPPGGGSAADPPPSNGAGTSDGQPAPPNPSNAPSPWGATEPAADTGPGVATDPVEEPVAEEPPPPANAGTVMVFLQGQAEGLQLIVDGRLRRGTFPHTIKLAPGSHRFRVQDKTGKGYEIGQTIKFEGRKAARVMLIAP